MKYEYNNSKDILRICKQENITIDELFIKYEMYVSEISKKEIFDKINDYINTMEKSIENGVKSESKTVSGFGGGQANILDMKKPKFHSKLVYDIMTAAIAVNEINANMGLIIAAPTAGSSGILPAVLLTISKKYKYSRNRVIRSFIVASGIGRLIADKVSISAAKSGCMAECGISAAMAAAGAVFLNKGTNDSIIHATSIVLKNVLGLVCDSVGGLVEVPCIKRNAIYAIHAITAAEMALAGLKSHIPLDEVIDAAAEIGKLMPPKLKETAKAGLANTKTAHKCMRKLKLSW